VDSRRSVRDPIGPSESTASSGSLFGIDAKDAEKVFELFGSLHETQFVLPVRLSYSACPATDPEPLAVRTDCYHNTPISTVKPPDTYDSKRMGRRFILPGA